MITQLFPLLSVTYKRPQVVPTCGTKWAPSSCLTPTPHFWLQVSQKDAAKVMVWSWGTTPGASYRKLPPNSGSHSREQAMKETTVPRYTHLTPRPLLPVPQAPNNQSRNIAAAGGGSGRPTKGLMTQTASASLSPKGNETSNLVQNIFPPYPQGLHCPKIKSHKMNKTVSRRKGSQCSDCLNGGSFWKGARETMMKSLMGGSPRVNICPLCKGLPFQW